MIVNHSETLTFRNFAIPYKFEYTSDNLKLCVHIGPPVSILNLYFDRTLSRICRNMESRNGILKWETVSNKRLDVDQTSRDEADSLGILA